MIQYVMNHQALTSLNSRTSLAVQEYTPGLLQKPWYMFKLKKIIQLLKHIHIYLPEELWLKFGAQVWYYIFF